MARIALFSDGTGNSASAVNRTNVWRTYQALDLSPQSNQRAFYDEGVGTSAFTPTALLGLAFGWGLARNVRQIYGHLCRAYQPGDEIFGFGFSRGAFTMRVVVSMIASQGLIDPERTLDDEDLNRLIVAAFRRYRKESFEDTLLSYFFRPVRDTLVDLWHGAKGRKPYDPQKNRHYHQADDDPPLIRFVGVWDTVDAYGSPIDEFTRAWDKIVWPLSAKDRNLSPRVARACHALALDEQRESFEPMLWNEGGQDDTRIAQVWFPGVHSNVGGGYPDDAMALISLDWMLDEGAAAGLDFLPEVRERFREQANLDAPMYDSRSGFGRFYRYAPRRIDRLCNEQKFAIADQVRRRLGDESVASNSVYIAEPKVHHSVFERIRSGTQAYAPINLPDDYVVIDSSGGSVSAGSAASDGSVLGEVPERASLRRRAQSLVWTKVWLTKVLYYVTLAVVLVWLVYPFARDDTVPPGAGSLFGFLEQILGSFSYAIRLIPEVVAHIPGFGFAQRWASEYAKAPFAFTFGLVAIGALLLAQNRMRTSALVEMRSHWSRGRKAKLPSLLSLRQRVAKLLEGERYRRWVERPLRGGLELLASLTLILVLVVLGGRLIYSGADAFGALCDADGPMRVPEPELHFDFDPAKACFGTNVELVQGKTYRITFSVDAQWSDGGIEADALGWLESPWYMVAFAPLRRHFFAPWYQPIARIDDKLLDIYPLAQGDDAEAQKTRGPESKPVQAFSTEIVARRTGRLYLYLNDAVIYLPGLFARFYKNNDGAARVTVLELSTSASPSSAHDAPPRAPG